MFSGFAAENQQGGDGVAGLGDLLPVPIFKATPNYFEALSSLFVSE